MNFLNEMRRRLPEYPPYYEAPSGNLLRLDQNANLLGPNPHVLSHPIDLSGAHLYPTRDNTPLLQAASRAFGVAPHQLFVGNGSDEILDAIVRTLVSPGGRVVSPHPSYSLYPHLCRLSRTQYVPVPFDSDFQVTARQLLEARPDLILVSNPNNPTGSLLDARIIGQVLSEFDGPVVVDEAYAEFSGASLIPLVGKFPNLLVTRTLSKAVGLAGLRVGIGVAHEDVAELIRRNKIPFSVNVVSEQLAIEALAHPEQVEATVRAVAKARDGLSQSLHDLGFTVIPSFANFVLTLPPIPSDELYEALRTQGILARTFPSEPALRDFVRFTVGRPEDNRRLLTALHAILSAEVGPS